MHRAASSACAECAHCCCTVHHDAVSALATSTPLSAPPQVYLGRYFETQVAIKILLNTGIGLDNAAAAAEMALSLSNPILYNLQQEATLMASLRHPNIVVGCFWYLGLRDVAAAGLRPEKSLP